MPWLQARSAAQSKVDVRYPRSCKHPNQDSIASAEATLKDKSSKIVVERGQIVKVSKDAKGIVKREALTQNWTDWIDYWAVDFNFESKREIMRVKSDRLSRLPCPGWSSRSRWICRIRRSVDRGLHFRERVAIVPHQERPLAGTDQRLSRMPAGSAQTCRQSGGHLRQRHHDHRGSHRYGGLRLSTR